MALFSVIEALERPERHGSVGSCQTQLDAVEYSIIYYLRLMLYLSLEY